MTDTPQPTGTVRSVGAVQWSEPCAELFAALSEAQGKTGRVVSGKTAKVKGKTDSGKSYEYEYTYADLASVLAAASGPLCDAGLALIQAPTFENGYVVVTTCITHKSGQWLSSTIAAQPTKAKIQGIGSAITYLRRYALTALLALAPADDDGAAASAPAGNQDNRPPVDHRDAFRKAWHSRLEVLVTANLTPLLSDDDRHSVQQHLWGVSSMAGLDDEHAQQELQNLRKTSDTLLAAIVNAVAIGVGECPHCKAEP